MAHGSQRIAVLRALRVESIRRRPYHDGRPRNKAAVGLARVFSAATLDLIAVAV
jgi:hypothetical protein